MKHWVQDFLEQSLRAIPDGAYRKRMEAELTDHLESLAHELEKAGWTPEEAQAGAVERMGDPTELARSYEAQWRESLRSPRRRVVRLGHFLNMVCYLIWMAVVGVLYIVNAPNFGKSVVGIYGLAAIPVAVFLLVLFVLKPDGSWVALQLGCWLYALMQGPPLLCWMVFGDTGFEISGVFVSRVVGLMFHGGMLFWSICNASILFRRRFSAVP